MSNTEKYNLEMFRLVESKVEPFCKSQKKKQKKKKSTMNIVPKSFGNTLERILPTAIARKRI